MGVPIVYPAEGILNYEAASADVGSSSSAPLPAPAPAAVRLPSDEGQSSAPHTVYDSRRLEASFGMQAYFSRIFFELAWGS